MTPIVGRGSVRLERCPVTDFRHINRSGIRCFLAKYTFSPSILTYIRTG